MYQSKFSDLKYNLIKEIIVTLHKINVPINYSILLPDYFHFK